jgi:hypothetical protein
LQRAFVGISGHVLTRKHLPATKSGELISMYIAEGTACNGSPDFATFMNQLQVEVGANSKEIANDILAYDSELKGHPFVYQMTLNLIAALNLPAEQKSQLFGKAFEQPYSFNEHGKITPMSANMTNAFMLMKNTGVTSEQAYTVIEKGFDVNKSNKKSLQEYVAKVSSYYPELVTKLIDK